jgi:Tfp pilus assembly protein PilF
MSLPGLLLAMWLQAGGAEPPSFREGLALVEAGRLEEAEKAFLAALASSPSHAPTSVALAKLYSQMGRHSEAQRVLEEALRLRPDGVVLWNELGSLLLATDRPQEAESRFRRVLNGSHRDCNR